MRTPPPSSDAPDRPGQPPARPTHAPASPPPAASQAPVACLLAALFWALILNLLSAFTWGYGPLNFINLIALGLLLAVTPALVRFLARRLRLSPFTARFLAPAFLIVAILASLAMAALTLAQELRLPENRAFLIDVGANTHRAAEHFFDEPHRNPYTHNSQLWHPLTPDLPHVTVTAEGTFLYSLPYRYGYPYFPVMFFSYQPFRLITPDFNAVRYGNAFLLLAALFLTAMLAVRLLRLSSPALGPAPGEPAQSADSAHSAETRRPAVLAALLAMFAMLCPHAWPDELFHSGVTDLLIAFYALLSLLALAHGRPALGGIALGLAAGCKLLPAPLFFPVLAAWLWRAHGRRSALVFTAAFALTAAAVILPFLLADPPAFLSATVLYYLTLHAEGDDTALYYLLPAALQPAFLALGAVAVVGLLAAYLLLPDRARSLARATRYCFLLYLVFIAFNRMTHLNYLWAILPLGAAAFAAESVAAAFTSAPAGSPASGRPAPPPRPASTLPTPSTSRRPHVA